MVLEHLGGLVVGLDFKPTRAPLFSLVLCLSLLEFWGGQFLAFLASINMLEAHRRTAVFSTVHKCFNVASY